MTTPPQQLPQPGSRETGRTWRTRLWVIILCFLVAAGFLAYTPRRTLTAVSLRIDPNPPLVFGVIPFLGPRELKARMEPLLGYLSRKLDRPVKLNVAADYESLARLLDEGRVEIAWFSHASYEHLGYGKPWKILCRPVQNNRVDYFGKIIVRADSPYRSIEDLRGRTFAYVERNSGSGFFFPNRLFISMNIDPLSFFGKVVFTHSHDSSIDGVIRGLYDAAAVYTITPDRANATMAALLRYVATTGPIPYDPLVTRADLPQEQEKAITDALLSMHLDPSAHAEVAQLRDWRNLNRFASEAEVQSILTSRQASETADPDQPALPAAIASEASHD